MAALTQCVVFGKNVLKIKHFSLYLRHYAIPAKNHFDLDTSSEYTDAPEYPEIYGVDYLSRQRRDRRMWYNTIRDLPTVEEKMFEIVKSGKKTCYMFDPLESRYDTLTIQQAATRTHFISGLPDFYTSINVDSIYEKMKPKLLEAIVASHGRANYPKIRPSPLKNERAEAMKLVTQLHHVIHLTLAADYPHIMNSEVDYDARIDCAWQYSGIPPRKRYRVVLKGLGYDEKNTPDDTWFQYRTKALLQVRDSLPLPQIVPGSDAICQEEAVAFPYRPESVGVRFELRYPTTTPGVWPGSACTFTRLAIHPRDMLIRRESVLGSKDNYIDTLHGGAIVACFSSLVGCATLQGFTIYNELTYPLNTQAVFTNGHDWSFYTYQLNTVTLSVDFLPHKRRNLCWGTEPRTLYHTVENGEVKGYDDEVMKTLLKMYIREPRSKFEGMRPYLGERVMEDEQWEPMMTDMLKWYSNKRDPPSFYYGTPMWEKIYKKWFYAKID